VLPNACATGYRTTSHAIEPANSYITWADAEAAGLGSKDYWQVADKLVPYVKSLDLFQCPTVIRRSRWAEIRTGVLTSGPAQGVRKVGNFEGTGPLWDWDYTGSYWWGCVHYPYGAGVLAADYVGDLGVLWVFAASLGYVQDTDNPQEYWACSNAVGTFDDPVWKPMAGCLSYGVHEGYSREYTDAHVIPVGLGGDPPTIPVAMPVAFVDGHVKYLRLGFYEMLALIAQPNEIQ